MKSFTKAIRAARTGLPICLFRSVGGLIEAVLFCSAELLEKDDLSEDDGLFCNDSYLTLTRDCISYFLKDLLADDTQVFKVPALNYDQIYNLISSSFDLPANGISNSMLIQGDDFDFCVTSILKNSELLPSAIAKKISFPGLFELQKWCAENSALCFDIDDSFFLHPDRPHKMEEVCKSALFLAAPGNNEEIKSTIAVYRDVDLCKTHYAITIGTVDLSQPVLTRVHSSCYTGDLLMSLSCDCFYQLRKAIEFMAENGGGVLVYLSQEGRGIGLVNKIRAYNLQQNHSCDTIDANCILGFAADERDFRVATNILKSIGIKKIKLITNNPKKSMSLGEHGIQIDGYVSLPFSKNRYNSDYIKTKIDRFGHESL